MKKKRYNQAVRVLLNQEESYRKEICGVIVAGLFIFSLLSLWSFNPYDSSWFYFSSTAEPITNWCGMIGAQLAGVLVYFFGSASYFFICSLLFPIGLLALKKPILKEWPRMVMLLSVVGVVSVLSSLYNYRIMVLSPGGVLGRSLCNFFVPLIGFGGTQLVMWGSLWVMINWMFEVSLVSYIPIVYRATQASAWFFWQLIVSMFEWSGICFNWMGVRAIWDKKSEAGVTPASSTENFEEEDVALSSDDQEKIVAEKREPDFWDNVDDSSIHCAQQNTPDYARVASSYAQVDSANKSTGRQDERGEDLEDFFLAEEEESFSFDELAERFSARQLYKHSRHIRVINKPFALPPNTALRVNVLSMMDEEKTYAEYISQEYQAALQQKKQAPKQKKFLLPSISLFRTKAVAEQDSQHDKESKNRARKLEEKLQHFGINGNVIAINPGPIITLFEYEPEMGTKLSKILSLEDDLAMALEAYSIRILAPIPGKNAVGFEIANETRDEIWFSQIFASKAFQEAQQELPLILGIDVVGNPVIQDLVSMPHLLVGGATGSGKSVGMNTMLLSLLCHHDDDKLKLILVDPKRLEFTPYADIPHLLFPIVTDPTKAINVLKWVVQEMEERYEAMSLVGVRNVREYNRLSQDVDHINDHEFRDMPYIVVMIDELADLMMVAGKDIEVQIVRIAQMARAAGIHLIVATQRPSVDVVTGLIKVNFPSRIAFRVSSKVDSRTIIDTQGAEKLLGKGDMLTMHASSSEITRVHGAYVSDQEVDRVATFLCNQKKADYLNINEVLEKEHNYGADSFADELYDDVLMLLETTNEISISMIQRHFRIGFNRSARLVEKLEMDGLVAPAQGGKPRKVLR